MRKYKSGFKNHISLLILVLIFCLSIGYAVINRTLNITGNSEIVKNIWDIHFDNVQVKDGSVTSVLPVIDNSTKTSISFNVMLNLPGDFYEFTVDVVNSGTMDAMADSIIKTPELTEEQKKYFDYIIEYQNGEQINAKQLVKSSEFVRLKVRVEYRTDITESDLPTTTEAFNLGFTVNYVQSDNTSVRVLDNGVEKVIPVAYGSIDKIGTVVSIGTERFYVIGTEGEKVKLLSEYNLHVGKMGYIDEDEDGEFITVLLETPTGKQSSDALGSNSLSYPHIGITEFYIYNSNANYSEYDYSIVKKYVDNYKKYLTLNYVTNIIEARLINENELNDSNLFDCDLENAVCSNKNNIWLYTTAYWTSAIVNDTNVWAFYNNGSIVSANCTFDDIFGVRPVILIAKSDIKRLIKFTIDGISYNAEEDMTWADWIDSKYNTIGLYLANDIVQLDENTCLKPNGLLGDIPPEHSYDLINSSYRTEILNNN